MNEEQREVAERLVADQSSSNLEWSRQVVALLRELAAEPVQEPVAWGVFVDDELFKPFNCKDNAVDWFQAQYNHGSRYDYLVLPLYAAPQQRKRLLASDIVTMYAECPTCDADMIDFARAIERAIIGEQK